MTKQMNNEHIRVAAYFLWEKAGCPNGRDLEFWNQAYNQLYGSTSKKNCNKSFSKTNTSKLTSKKVTVKPVLSKKSTSAKPVLAAKPFYGIKK